MTSPCLGIAVEREHPLGGAKEQEKNSKVHLPTTVSHNEWNKLVCMIFFLLLLIYVWKCMKVYVCLILLHSVYLFWDRRQNEVKRQQKTKTWWKRGWGDFHLQLAAPHHSPTVSLITCLTMPNMSPQCLSEQTNRITGRCGHVREEVGGQTR